MRAIQALRRSIKGDKDKGNNPNIAHKSPIAIVPPKKVIRALYDYEARSDKELSFSRGDFFHVISNEDDSEWYEACNPALPDARGLVPVAFFQALGRTERDSGHSDGVRGITSPIKLPDNDSGFSESHIGAPQPISSPALKRISQPGKAAGPPGPVVYGRVMYDFKAERADEFNAQAGEAIIIIAQSNPEWLVAKPIGRLGHPGLIPVSFVEIRDMATDKPIENPEEAIRKAGVPKVEEWKRRVAEYNSSGIALGKFEGPGSPGSPSAGGSSQQPQSLANAMDRMSLQQNGKNPAPPNGQQNNPNGHRTNQEQYIQQVQQNHGPDGSSQLLCPISARIPRYCFAEDKYWFVIEAVLEDGRHWELSRYYEDFYDFQIALLTEFPAEAGNTGQQKRSLPYMPGPVNYVNDAITEGRLHNLDAYVKNLLNQPHYISRCMLVKQFFHPREGDYESDPNEMGDYRLSQGSQGSADNAGHISYGQSRNVENNGGGYGGLSATPRHPGGQQAGQPQAANQAQSGASMKIKMYFNDDLIAIRVPADIQFQQLYDKIRDRLKVPAGERLELFYKDEATGDNPNLMSDNDLDFALQRNEKLLLYVEVA
ncbi:unnamed protein product [Clonostachys rhizophaga]|uniref:Bud emergence protein 1 n=1 Tax=Clonostachys rhizophaga TaxID=160324 RepID=A0A9N9V5I3_9HYPO|nr:unnamed protein product [Clonostachys rhizophaga]